MSEADQSQEWQRALTVDELVDGEPSSASAHGEEIAVYRVDDQIFATSNICTHGLARLSDGYLEGHVIECPLHQGLFDVRDGRCIGAPAETDIRSYETRVVDGVIEVRPKSAS